MLFVQPLDVCEGLLSGGEESCPSLPHAPLVLVFLVESLVVCGVAAAGVGGKDGSCLALKVGEVG